MGSCEWDKSKGTTGTHKLHCLKSYFRKHFNFSSKLTIKFSLLRKHYRMTNNRID